jgi:hypothetical protein
MQHDRCRPTTPGGLQHDDISYRHLAVCCALLLQRFELIWQEAAVVQTAVPQRHYRRGLLRFAANPALILLQTSFLTQFKYTLEDCLMKKGRRQRAGNSDHNQT